MPTRGRLPIARRLRYGCEPRSQRAPFRSLSPIDGGLALVFSSLAFVCFFLPIVALVYLVIRVEFRNAFLLLASLLFYTWGGGAFVGWLLASIVGNWLLGLLAARARRSGSEGRRRAAVTLSVVVNLALLGWFKYANFLVVQLHALGMGFAWTELALPIGISFFTFHSMSYVIDISRGDAEALANPFDFALYVALFPQLVAGPIVRFREISEQIRSRSVRTDDVMTGATRFALGLSKKVLVADSVAPLADAVFAPGASIGVGDAWLGMFAFGVQIYFDFSGYSDMAVGMGRIFGFRIPENFRRPYAAESVTDFWRRWHITLSSWFRDYVYFPLGGSRASAAKTFRNLITIFVLTGVWHGASFTFLAWGLYHGTLLIFERLTGLRTAPHGTASAISRRAYTLLAVMLGWVIFRADTLGGALHVYGALVGFTAVPGADATLGLLSHQALAALLFGLGSALVPGTISAGVYLDTRASVGAAAYRYAIALVALPLALMIISSSTFSPFLYYRF